MMHVVVPHRPHESEQPIGQLSWWVYHHPCEDEGVGPFVLMECPNGHVGTLRHVHLAAGHEIGADGTVSPSVRCFYSTDGGHTNDCDFHEFVTLEGWSPL